MIVELLQCRMRLQV